MNTPASSPAAGRRRCHRCAVESAEPGCFTTSRLGMDQRPLCITCAEREVNDHGQLAYAYVAGLLLPIVLMSGLYPKAVRDAPWAVLAAVLLVPPLTILVHELGHLCCGKLLRLEVPALSLGLGPRLSSFELFGVIVNLRPYPLVGSVAIGARDLARVRTRVWLTVLAGPLTNIAMLAVAMLFFARAVALVGISFTVFWSVQNLLAAVYSLVPRRSRRGSLSDGLQLLQIPTKTEQELSPYLATPALMRGYHYLLANRFEDLQALAKAALVQLPEEPALKMLLASAQFSLGDYAAATATEEDLLAHAELHPLLRAHAELILALSLWFDELKRGGRMTEDGRAYRLTLDCYLKYPCVLSHRNARSLLLSAAGRSEEALALLDYANYRYAGRQDRADQAIARAYAHKAAGQPYQLPARIISRGYPTRPPWLALLGFKPEVS